MIKQNSNEISVLEKKIDRASTVDEKAQAMADLAWKIKHSDPPRAVELGDKAIQLSRSIDLETCIPKSYLAKAMGFLYMSRFKDAEKSAHMGLSSYRKLDSIAGIRHALNVMGSIYFRWGKYPSALENFLESLRIHSQLSSTPDPGILSNIGAVYLQLGDTDRALECYTQVKKMADKVEGPADLKTAALINMSEIYSRMGIYDDALECLVSAYEICLANDMKQAVAATADDIGIVMSELDRCDEAMEHFNESIEIFRSLGDVKGEALVLSHMGKCSLTCCSGKAMEFYLESLKGFQSLSDSHGIAEALIGISRVMVELGRNDQALLKLGEALKIAQKKGLYLQLSEIHGDLSSILEREGKYDTALEHLKLYHKIENELRSERTANRLCSLRVTHQVEKARKEAALYKLQNIELEENREQLEDIIKSKADDLEKDHTRGEVSLEARTQSEREADRDRNLLELTGLVSRIAHDLNSILTSAVGNAEIVLLDKTLSEESRNKLVMVMNSMRDCFPIAGLLSTLSTSEEGEANASEGTSEDVADNTVFSKISRTSKVLIVEDDPGVAELLITTFEAYGYPVITSASLKKARTIIGNSLDDIGCMFIDIILPDGSGIDLIREVRQLRPNFPVLAGSGHSLSKMDLDFMRDNRIMFIKKPYQIDSLMLKLASTLSS